MAHKGKRDSRYLTFNSDAKRWINTCVLCKRIGHAPQILRPDFDDHLIRRAIVNALTESYEPLPLDDTGRCSDCADSAE